MTRYFLVLGVVIGSMLGCTATRSSASPGVADTTSIVATTPPSTVTTSDAPNSTVITPGQSANLGPTTKGVGGMTCQKTVTHFGVSYCLATLGGVELKLVLPKNTSRPLLLGIYLHGDTAADYYGDWGFTDLAKWTRENGIVLAAVLAPNTCSWWRDQAPKFCGGPTLGDGTNGYFGFSSPKDSKDPDYEGRGADALNRVIMELGARYDLQRKPILYVGFSGGSHFITGGFIPRYGATRAGIAAVNCGGIAPYTDFIWDPKDDAHKDWVLAFTVGEHDFVLGDAQKGAAYYRERGFDVNVHELPGVEHCGYYDWISRTITVWSLAR